MLWNYQAMYDLSIDWEVITTAEAIEFPALTIEGGLLDHEITAEKYLLEERYSGTKIKRSLVHDQLYLGIIWLGVCFFLAASTYFNRYLFFTVVAATALMMNRFNLFEVGLFGIHSKMIMLLPFLAMAGPMIYFHEFNQKVSFRTRSIILIASSAILCFGISDDLIFTNHLLAHSVFCFGICILVFLVFISEEIIFALLYVVSSSKGKSNHIHFIILSLVYLGNLVLYYLNKSGLYDNSFFFFDPYLLFTVSCLVAAWSLKYKTVYQFYIPQKLLIIVFASLGIISMGFLSLSMNRGIDAIHQSFHYFILYFHIGFGFFFFFYILSNFLDPLVKGLQIWKIAYKERNFPYVTSKLGGIVCIAAFYFLSSQEPYNLLRSGYYNYLGEAEKTVGDDLLAKEYWIQATFLGYNTHYPNYKLGWEEWDRNKDFQAKTNFFKAASRFPSPYAWVNYGNLELDMNPSKVQAVYEEALRTMESPEMKNNLGLIHLGKGNLMRALSYFEMINPSDEWNDAPRINEWNVYSRLDSVPTALNKDFLTDNCGVKANILFGLDSTSFTFSMSNLREAIPIHRQAYLLNSAFLFNHDSISSLLRREIEGALLSSTSNRLSKALALHLYKKGEVNAAFRILDNLQAAAPRYAKGEFLDILGKLALDQNAYTIALEYFTKAVQDRFEAGRVSRLEVFAALGNKESFQSDLLKIVERDPGLTSYANELIERFDNYSIRQKEYPVFEIEAHSDTSLYLLGLQNAFNEELVLDIVDELKRRNAKGAYDILIESIEVNKSSPALLKAYIISALDWGLIQYTIPVMNNLKALIPEEEFENFRIVYESKKREANEDVWQ